MRSRMPARRGHGCQYANKKTRGPLTCESFVLQNSLLVNGICEVVLAALRVAGMQQHFAARLRIRACSTCNCQRGIRRIVEGTFDCDLAIGQGQRPDAFPSFSNRRTSTLAVIVADFILVGLIVDFVSEI